MRVILLALVLATPVFADDTCVEHPDRVPLGSDATGKIAKAQTETGTLSLQAQLVDAMLKLQVCEAQQAIQEDAFKQGLCTHRYDGASRMFVRVPTSTTATMPTTTTLPAASAGGAGGE